MLKVSDLTLYYGASKVLDNLNLILDTNQVHGLVGLNGAGKTSLLNVIYGFVKPLHGKVSWEDKEISPYLIAFLEAENFFYPYLTGADYLQLCGHSVNTMEEWNQLFDLPLKKLIEEYSTGMRKKLALLGILSLKRAVYILDEPFNGLDLESAEVLKAIIVKLKSTGHTILITSHIIESLSSIADKIHYLHEGKIEKSFTRENFAEMEQLIGSRLSHKGLVVDRLFG
jgi:ABC-2 type transport system ATP-binding protein